MIQEPDVETGVVCDQHGISNESEEIVGHFRKLRRIPDHRIRNAGQHRDEERYRHLRIYQRVKFVDDRTALYAIRSDFRYTARRSLGAGRLQIEYDKTSFREIDAIMIAFDQLDRVAIQNQTRVAIDYIRDQETRKRWLDTSNIHDAIDNGHGRSSAADRRKKINRQIGEERVANEVWMSSHLRTFYR